MTPDNFLTSFVEGNFDDCQANPGCIRRAFNAAVAASQLADHFFQYNLRHNPESISEYSSIGPYVEYLTKETDGAFKDIRSIANAYKHLYTDPESNYGAHSNVDSSGAIESILLSDDPNLSKVEEEYLSDQPMVVFTRRDGSTLEFLPVLEQVVAYWRSSLRKHLTSQGSRGASRRDPLTRAPA